MTRSRCSRMANERIVPVALRLCCGWTCSEQRGPCICTASGPRTRNLREVLRSVDYWGMWLLLSHVKLRFCPQLAYVKAQWDARVPFAPSGLWMEFQTGGVDVVDYHSLGKRLKSCLYPKYRRLSPGKGWSASLPSGGGVFYLEYSEDARRSQRHGFTRKGLAGGFFLVPGEYAGAEAYHVRGYYARELPSAPRPMVGNKVEDRGCCLFKYCETRVWF
ncbi:hypothetical protein CI238_10017 [Colletotrichum incanum]|uniref:Uncharacterized protein n=1 Tax=Colletotrichum incanum TaxID=1573173 RepID=A0A167ANI5_COLIC|nr:hypothetical protein CI238_10017 [Colletotrichum incanum]